MAESGTQQIRNVALLSHTGAGTTMVSEAMLFAAGLVSRAGKTDEGTTTSDFDPEETKRRTSVQTSVLPIIWNSHKLNILDTPGYADYIGEVASAMRVADSAVIVISAAAGLEVGAERAWKIVVEKNLARLLFVNKLDRDNTDFHQVLASIKTAFGRSCVAIQAPLGSSESFTGTIDLLGSEVPDEVSSLREQLIEAIAETDDDLVEKYLEGEELSEKELRAGLKQGVARGIITPVLLGSALAGVGADGLMDSIAGLLPSPADVGPAQTVDGKANLEIKADGPLAALLFKTTADPFVGKLSFFKVYSGSLKSDSQVLNVTRNDEERISQTFLVRGKSQEPVPEIVAGDIGSVAKLQTSLTGDTITTKGSAIRLVGVGFPEPVFSMAVTPKSQADLDKMTSGLTRIAEEDPSLRIDRDPGTLEIIMRGQGETHLAVAVEKIKRKFGVEIELKIPKVPYKETIRGTSKVEYKHKKQSGGHGQYGHVWLELEPLDRSAGFEFGNKVVGGSVPREYVPAVEKGVVKAMASGVLAGFPVVDVRVKLVDGSSHPVDSSGIAFEIAGSHALSKGVKNADPTLLEPVLQVSILSPDSATGEITGGLSGKRGQILGMTPESDGYTRIEAEVPQAEMLQYATELRSLTGGRGMYTATFVRMGMVPDHLLDKILEEQQNKATTV